MQTLSPDMPQLHAPLQTLLVDDSDFDRQRIRRISQRAALPIDVTDVPSISAMRPLLAARPFDLILLDYQLGDGDGLSALNLIKSSPAQAGAGLIMVTGNQRLDIAVSAFRRGYHDVINKEDMTADAMRDAILRSQNLAKSAAPAQLETLIQRAVQESLHGAGLQQMIASAPAGQRSPPHVAPQRPSPQEDEILLQGLLARDEFRF
ncbi:response regulator [Cognatishimia sp. SS12]|uniref:response regulator n=1 Tax=Cognatishimia sp. SS12 TaxID=2979465 RepID=UPI0023304B49|nr:response regulator [Cognatishimia sp. SS12]MDC0738481.1 response regulator [Cognatishimia sp. SS12]